MRGVESSPGSAADTSDPRQAQELPRLAHRQLTRPLHVGILAVAAFWALSTVAVVAAAGGGAAAAATAAAVTGGYAAAGLTALLVRRWELRQMRELVDALNRATKRLAALSTLDDLTGLHNRRYFYWQLERELQRAKRYGTLFAIVVFDIDGLKRINDGLGHLAGDQLLRTFARVMRENARASDTCARIGGDEFASLALNTTYQTAQALAERLAASFAATPIDLSTLEAAGGSTISGSASWGVSAYSPRDDAGGSLDATDIISWADRDLSARKIERREARGSGRVR